MLPTIDLNGLQKESHIRSRSGQELSKIAIESLKRNIKGEIVVKGESSTEVYNEAIDRWNKIFPKEAGIVVFVESEEDIAFCLKYVQEHDLDLAIVCGRHTWSAASSTDGGLAIDLKKMNRVVVDKTAMTVTAQGGCQAKDLEVPAEAEGLSVTLGNVNDTGIGGLSLGGGTGPLTGQYGYAVDNILSVRVVLASGEIVEASKDSNPDLFWGIRGGGSNFGVVSQFVFRAHNQGQVFHGPLIFSPDKASQIIDLIPTIQSMAIKSGGKLGVFIVFAQLPGTTQPSPIALTFYDGPEAEAREILRPLLAVGPVVAAATMKTMTQATTPKDGYSMPVPYNRAFASSAHIIPPLDTDIYRDVLEEFRGFLKKWGSIAAPSKVIMEIRSHEVSSQGLDDMAFAGRTKGVAFLLEAQYSDAANDEAIKKDIRDIIGRARERLAIKQKDSMEEVGSTFIVPNLDSDSYGTVGTFGKNLPRLKELKKRYDPNFIFNKWHPISPA